MQNQHTSNSMDYHEAHRTVATAVLPVLLQRKIVGSRIAALLCCSACVSTSYTMQSHHIGNLHKPSQLRCSTCCRSLAWFAWVTTSTNMGIGPYSKKSGGLHPQLIKKMPIQCPQRRLFTPQMPGCIYACERGMMHLNNTIVQKSTSDIYVHI
jgi:hypothetical protein